MKHKGGKSGLCRPAAADGGLAVTLGRTARKPELTWMVQERNPRNSAKTSSQRNYSAVSSPSVSEGRLQSGADRHEPRSSESGHTRAAARAVCLLGPRLDGSFCYGTAFFGPKCRHRQVLQEQKPFWGVQRRREIRKHSKRREKRCPLKTPYGGGVNSTANSVKKHRLLIRERGWQNDLSLVPGCSCLLYVLIVDEPQLYPITSGDPACHAPWWKKI